MFDLKKGDKILLKDKLIFETKKELLKELDWFNVENTSDTHVYFFNKTPTNYNKKAIYITDKDLF